MPFDRARRVRGKSRCMLSPRRDLSAAGLPGKGSHRPAGGDLGTLRICRTRVPWLSSRTCQGITTNMHRTPPDFESLIYTPQRISAVVATLAEDGIGAAELLAGSNLDEPALLLPQTRVSYRQVATVFRNAERLAPESAFALRAGSR